MAGTRSRKPGDPSPGLPLAVLIVTHGHLGRELLEAAEEIVGPLPRFQAISVAWNGDPEAARDRIGAALDALSPQTRVVILTDMFGGTPTNLSLSFLEKGRVEVVTGVNLPMVIKFANLHGAASLGEVLAQVTDKAREGIRVATEVLKR